MYTIIESVITKTIPLWNMTLTPLKEGHSTSWRIKYELEYEVDPEDMAEELKPQQEEGEDEDDYWERREEWENNMRQAKQPEPAEFKPEELPQSVDLVKDYAHRGLQVIVK